MTIQDAAWCDENTRIVCEIFADKVQKGNRSRTHLNKTGYKNVIQMFHERTATDHEETGIGWDESEKNIVISKTWWKETSAKIKGCTRFKNGGLQNEEKLGTIFEDLCNTSDDHWCASSGAGPSQTNLSCDEVDNDDDSEPEEVTPVGVLPGYTRGRGKRGRGADNKKGKKPKTSVGHWFQEQMSKIVEMNERTTASCESITRREDKSVCSIQDVMALVKDCGVVPGTNEHFIASLVFTKKAKREMFMT
uniref:Myb/SANT-like domain-containing protein n=1 Tax=Setaria viridis TaxID=4556 RepID=A0A4U6VGE8_SETVI|nr:hypothetical protein SEVIR_3G285800v2 [Setaria viridis]